MLSPKDEIKNKLNIVEVIGQYVKLQKVGSNYRGLCPFHNDKNPSFYVSPSRQIWHCFGCGAGGDIFTFIMKIENVDFPTALKILAEKAGVKLKPENPQRRSQKQKLFQINQIAARFFKKNLWDNKEALAYLQKRGLKESVIRNFNLGWAEDEWRSLSAFLIKEGFQPQDIVASGLAISKKEPREINKETQIRSPQLQSADIYDRFRRRIMFPVEDSVGRLCGFTGRIFTGSKALKTIKDVTKVGKYVNSPQTLVFDKSQLLFGLSRSKKYLYSRGSTIIVEGQMDFLAAWQANIKNIVATSGTALTSTHLSLLKRYNNTLILGFDMDEAGKQATEKGIDLALGQEMEVKVLLLPQGKDLADYLLEPKNQVRVQSLIEEAIPIMDFYFQRAQEQGDRNAIQGKKKIASYFLPRIKKLKNALERAFWVEKLAHYLDISSQSLEDELNRIHIDSHPSEVALTDSFLESSSSSRIDILADRILAFLIKFPKWRKLIIPYKEYFSSFQKKVLQTIESLPSSELQLKESVKMKLDEQLIDKINQLALQADYEIDMLAQQGIAPKEEFENELKMFEQEAVRKQLDKIEKEIQEKEKSNEKEKVEELMKKFNQLSKHLIS